MKRGVMGIPGRKSVESGRCMSGSAERGQNQISGPMRRHVEHVPGILSTARVRLTMGSGSQGSCMPRACLELALSSPLSLGPGPERMLLRDTVRRCRLP